MTAQIHKIGDVLEINVHLTVTSCVVIDFKKEILVANVDHVLKRGIFMIDSSEPSILKSYSYGIWAMGDIGRRSHIRICSLKIHNAYKLLIGDKKVWFEYDQ